MQLKKVTAILTFFLFPLLVKAQYALHKTTVWETGEDNVFAHFVYGLTVTVKGTVLAFAEARTVNGSDQGAHHIVLKRSIDGGDSFSVSTVLVRSTEGQSWANPTVVQDNSTGTVFLFFARNYGNRSSEVFYIKSHDDGLNWTEATAVTPLFKNNAQEWTFHLPGPGHGIQLNNGRLILPVWHRKDISFPAARRNYGVNCIYSDDHGLTWKAGEDTPAGQFNESQLVTKTNGGILLIGRMLSAKNFSNQAKVLSRDQGRTWTKHVIYDKRLTGAVCDIGLVRYAVKPNIILVSQPADPKKRRDLVIRMSTNEGRTWKVAKLLQEGAATYSDLAVLPDKSIICLYGTGNRNNMPERVLMARFDLRWLREQALN